MKTLRYNISAGFQRFAKFLARTPDFTGGIKSTKILFFAAVLDFYLTFAVQNRINGQS